MRTIEGIAQRAPFSLRTPQRNRNELGETSVNKTWRKRLPCQEKSTTYKMFTAFGTQGSQVQILPLRPVKSTTYHHFCLLPGQISGQIRPSTRSNRPYHP